MRVDRQDLYNVLKELSCMTTRSTVADVLLEAKDGILSLTTTDLTARLSCELPAEGNDLTACLPAKLLAMLVKPEGKGSAGEVAFGVEGDKITVTLDGVKTHLPASDPTIFPAKFSTDERWSLVGQHDAPLLHDALSWVLPAVSTDITRKHLNSVFIDQKVVVATDGHRLHLAPSPLCLDEPLLIPSNSAATLMRMLKQEDQALMARYKSELLWVRCGSWELITKLMDEEFPPYNHVIPDRDTQNCQVVFDSNALSKAITQVMKLSEQGSIRLCINGAVTLSPGGSTLGDVDVIVPTVQNNHIGNDLALGVDGKYLAMGVPRGNELVELSLSGSLDPLRIDLSGEKLAVIMPMRL